MKKTLSSNQVILITSVAVAERATTEYDGLGKDTICSGTTDYK